VSNWIPAWATHYKITSSAGLGPREYLEIEFYENYAWQEGIIVEGMYPIENLAKDLAIADVCRQIRNNPLPKQNRYKNDPSDEEDYIDKTYRTMPWQEFVGAIKWTIGKYFDRFGKKDDILKEAIKIEDYAIRFRQKVELEVAKQKKINERV